MGKKKQKKLKPATAEGLELISACERGDIPKIKARHLLSLPPCALV